MLSIWPSISIMIGCSLILFIVLIRILRNSKPGWSTIVAITSATGLVAHAVWLNENPALTRLISSPNIIIWGNLSPIFAAMLSASACVKMPGPQWQRVLACTALLGICFHQAYWTLLGYPPELKADRWTHGVCRQSTISTCSAAASATLLTTLGIPTNEKEMADLCLTRERGTSTLGIYRGLRIKSGRPVRIFDGTLPDLLALHQPAVISIGLSNNDPGGVGLPIGNNHSVVLFGQNVDGSMDIGDPFAGRQKWTMNQLEKAWHHEAFIIEQ